MVEGKLSAIDDDDDEEDAKLRIKIDEPVGNEWSIHDEGREGKHGGVTDGWMNMRCDREEGNTYRMILRNIRSFVTILPLAYYYEIRDDKEFMLKMIERGIVDEDSMDNK